MGNDVRRASKGITNATMLSKATMIYVVATMCFKVTAVIMG
jgi:hypothetical protein